MQNPRGVVFYRTGVCALSPRFCSGLCFQQVAASFFLFGLFLRTGAFVFRGLQPLLRKHPGYGGVSEGADGLMHCTVKPGRNCISFSLTAVTPFAATARSETQMPL